MINSTCGEHSGVCANIYNVEKEIDCLSTQNKQKLDSRIFFSAVGVLVLIFGGFFTMCLNINDSISEIKSCVKVQSANMQYMQNDIKDIKMVLK